MAQRVVLRAKRQAPGAAAVLRKMFNQHRHDFMMNGCPLLSLQWVLISRVSSHRGDFCGRQNDSPGSSGRSGPFRLKFGWPVVPHRNLDHCRRRSGAGGLQPSLSGSRLCDAGGVGHAQRLAAPQLLSRSPPRASRAGSLPKVPALKRSTLHARSKHAEILSKQAEIVLKRAENTRKTVDWLVTFASISPSQRPCAYAGKGSWTQKSKFAVARAWLARGLRSAERGDFDRPPRLVRPLSVSQMLLGASCVWANC